MTTSLLQIPLAQIMPNPDNPRHVITPEMVDSLANSMKTVGLKNPIKVQKLKSGKGEPKQPPEVATSQTAPIGAAPRNDSNLSTYEFELISGHIRLAAAQKLGWESIPAMVLDLTPEQALLEAILDNQGQPMSWLDLYEAVETMQKVNPSLNQQEIGDRLEIDQTTVSRAKKLMGLLTPISRALLYEQFIKPDMEPITQRAVYALTSLPDAQSVEKALTVAINRKMTEAQVKKMLEWVKNGNSPDAYMDTGKGTKGERLKDKDQAKAVEPPRHQVHQERLSQGVKDEPAEAKAQSTAGSPNDLPTNAKVLGRGAGMAAHWAWTNPLQVFKLIGGWIKQLAVKDAERIHQGLIRKAVGWVFDWGMAILLVGGAYVGATTIWNHQGTKFTKEGEKKVGGSTTTASASKPTDSTPLHLGTFSHSTSGRTNSLDDVKKANQEWLKASVEKDSKASLLFAQYFYGANYLGTKEMLGYFKETVSEGFYKRFMDENFPPQRITQIETRKLLMTFEPTQSPKLLGSDDTSVEFWIQGVMTTKTDVHGKTEEIEKKPVALRVSFLLVPGGKDRVFALREVPADSLSEWAHPMSGSRLVTSTQGPGEAQKGSGSASETDEATGTADKRPMDADKDDSVAKAVGAAAGEAAKKFLGL